MNNNELSAVIEQLSEFQIEQIRKMAESFLNLNEELSNTKPTNCPCCKSVTARFIKKGFSGRKQRYQCKECGKKFTYDIGKFTSFSQQSDERWAIFIEDTFNLQTLDYCAKHLDVCHATAFNMRQKLMGFLEDAMKQTPILDGMIEADETYVQNGKKGICVSDRKPRKHGESATKRGLSREQVCICVAADRDGNMIATCVNSGKPSAENIKNAIGNKIADGAVFQCDGEKAYNKMIEEKNCTKVILHSHEDYNKVYHLNTVNGLHSRLKDLLKHFRGVSTKYLNRYLAMFTAMQMAARSEKQDISDFIRSLLFDVYDFLPIRCLMTERLLTV